MMTNAMTGVCMYRVLQEHPEKKEQLVPLVGRGRDQAGLFL